MSTCILQEKENKMNSKRVWSEQSTYEKQSFTWELPNFLEMRESDDVISAQHFTFEMGQSIGLPSQWKCYLNASTDGVCIKLLKNFSTVEEIPVHASVQVKYAKSDKFYFNESINETLCENDIVQDLHEVIPSENKINNVLVNGSLLIQLNMTIFNISDKPRTIQALLNTFQSKFAQKFQTDKVQGKKDATSSSRKTVTIISKDGTKFHANRNILVARSPIFQIMFETQTWAERESSVVKVEDMSAQALQILLFFLETGILDLETNFWENIAMVEELCYAAHKYMLDDLTEFLDNGLGLLCTFENFGHLTVIAKRFGMQKAKQDLLDYLRQNFDLDSLSFGDDLVAPENLAKDGNEIRVILQQKQNHIGFTNKIATKRVETVDEKKVEPKNAEKKEIVVVVPTQSFSNIFIDFFLIPLILVFIAFFTILYMIMSIEGKK